MAGSKSQTASDESTKLAQWIWSIVLRLRLHANSWPTGCSPEVTPRDAAVHETIAHYVSGERQLALAAFLALVTSRCGHRLMMMMMMMMRTTTTTTTDDGRRTTTTTTTTMLLHLLATLVVVWKRTSNDGLCPPVCYYCPPVSVIYCRPIHFLLS